MTPNSRAVMHQCLKLRLLDYDESSYFLQTHNFTGMGMAGDMKSIRYVSDAGLT